MSKVANIDWSDFTKALGLELSDNPLEDYGGIDFAYEAGTNFIREYEVENEVELSEEAKQEIIDQFSMSLESHWSASNIMRHNLNLDSLVDDINDWGKRGPQSAIYTDRQLPSGIAVSDVKEGDAGVQFTLEEPFVTTYAEAAYAVHGIGDEGRELDDMDGKDVARVIRWIAEAEGRSIDRSLDLDRWDQQWNGPKYQALQDIASRGTVAQNEPEDVVASEFIKRVASIDFDRMSVQELSEWIDRTMRSYLSFKNANPEQIDQLQPVLKNLQMAQMVLDIRKGEEGEGAAIPVRANNELMQNELTHSEDPRQMNILEDEDTIEKVAVEDVDWDSELYEGEPKLTLNVDPDNIGAWIESSDPTIIGDKIQQYAKKFGWDGDIKNSAEDGFYDAVQEAEEFMNTKAPQGYFFGTNEDGDWGMWEGETDLPFIIPEDVTEAEVVAAPEDVAESEEKEVSEMGEEMLPEHLKASRKYGGTVQHLMRLADVMPEEVRNELARDPQLMAEQDSITGKWVVKKKIVASHEQVFNQVSILSEFHDDLHPRMNETIDVGSKVFVRPIKRFGEVIRTLDEGGAFRVQAGDQTNTYFRQELEVRKTSR